MDGSLLLGGERADELRARTMARIALLRTKFRRVDLVWECSINSDLAKYPLMKQWFSQTEVCKGV